MSPAPSSVSGARNGALGRGRIKPRLRVALAPDGTVAVRRWMSAKGAHTRAEKTERVQQLQDLLHSGETVTVAEATEFLSVESRNSSKASWRTWWTRDG